MATIPVVNTVDKRIGLVSAVALLLITFVVLYLLTYDIPNPLPVDREVPAVAIVDELILKELKIEGGGGGTPKDAPVEEPKPQTQTAITSTSKPRPTTTPSGQANSTNDPNSQNTSSTTQPSTNPFGDGGSGTGTGGGTGTGVGTTDGSSGTGPGGDGIGIGKRTRQNDVNVHDISIETDAKIYFKLTVDSDGNVVAFSHYKSNTTTTDQTLINKIGYAIKKQVKYNKSPGSTLEYQDYTVSVKAT